MGDSGQATETPADASGADADVADPDASAGLDRVATLVTTGCALVLATFATVELAVVGPRPTTLAALVGSLAAALAGGLAVRSAGAGPALVRLRTVRDGTLAALTGAITLLVVGADGSPVLAASGVLLVVVGVGLFALAVPSVRSWVGLDGEG
jgi:hypothetical protein